MHTQRTELASRIGKLAHTIAAVGDDAVLVMPLIDDVAEVSIEASLTPGERTMVETWIRLVSENPAAFDLPAKGKYLARLLNVRL